MPRPHSLRAQSPGLRTSFAFICCSCGRKKLSFSFEGTAAAPSSFGASLGMKSVGKFGGASVDDTCGAKRFLNSVHTTHIVLSHAGQAGERKHPRT